MKTAGRLGGVEGGKALNIRRYRQRAFEAVKGGIKLKGQSVEGHSGEGGKSLKEAARCSRRQGVQGRKVFSALQS